MKAMNCLIYTRVSSTDQVTNFSLETQEEICRKVAQDRGYSVDKVYREEGVSAKTANRPQLIELLEYARHNKNKISTVLVYKWDRLARQTSDHLAIKAKLGEYGIHLESATEPSDNSPAGIFVETLLAGVAQMNNEVSSERIRVGVKKRFFSGLITSAPPLGYEMSLVNGKRIPVPSKYFESLQKIWHLMATGTKSLSDITKIMNQNGLKVRYGGKNKRISKQTASSIFKNRFYCGYLSSKRHPDWVARGIHPPLVSEETFNRVRAIILGKTQCCSSIKKRVNNPNFPLRGQVKCDVCGRTLVAGNCRGRSKTYPKYWCINGCIPSISSDDLLFLFNQSLRGITYSDKLIDLFNFRLKVIYERRKGRLLAQKKSAEKEIIENKQMMTLLVENHLKGLYSDEIFREQKAKLEDNLLSAQVVASDSAIEKYDIEAITNFVSALLRDLPKAYEVSDYGQKRLLCGSIYPSGLCYDGKTLLNHHIGPSFRVIKDFCEARVPSGADKFTQIEPLLSTFNTLILAYPNYKNQFSYVH